MSSTYGKQFKVPVKTSEGLDGEVNYTELEDAYMVDVATKTKNSKILRNLQRLVNSNKGNLMNSQNTLFRKDIRLKRKRNMFFKIKSFFEG